MTAQLPAELITAIANAIEKRADLLVLVLACKRFAAVLKTQLEYFHIRVVPEAVLKLWELFVEDKLLARNVRVLELVAFQRDMAVSTYYDLPFNPPRRLPPGIREEPFGPLLETTKEDILTERVLSAVKNMTCLTTFHYAAPVNRFNRSFCERLWKTLSECDGLRNVSLREIAEDPNGLWDHAKFYSLKNMTSITYIPILHPDNCHDGNMFVEMLGNSPALEVLYVDCYGLEHQDDDLQLDGIAGLRLPALREVTMGGSYVAETESIIEFLTNNPTIEILTLNSLDENDDAITLPKLPRNFLPNIREISGADELAQLVAQRQAKTKAWLEMGHTMDDHSDGDTEDGGEDGDENRDEDEGGDEGEDEDEDEDGGEEDED